MDPARLPQYAFYAFIALAGAVWALLLVRSWAPAAKRRGGIWYLEAILLIAGPICITTAALAQGADGLQHGPFEAINRYARYTAIGLSVLAMVGGLRNPRPRLVGLTSALGLFYFALLLSGMAGAEFSIPDSYYLTPLVLFAFLLPGNYSHEWLLLAGRFSLRLILIATAASAVLVPALAFRVDGTRQAFGIPQLQGLTGHPNTLAALGVLGLILEVTSRSKWPWRAFFAISILGAQSSTGYIAAAVGLLVLSGKGSKAVRYLLVAAAGVVAATFIFLPKVIEGVISVVVPASAETLTGRTGIWSAAMVGFETHPIFGYGPTLLNDEYRGNYLPGFEAAAQAHNQFVQTLAGAGLVGVVTLLVLAVVLAVYAANGHKYSRGLSWALLVVMTLRCVTETPLRPTGVGFESFVLVVVLGLIATACTQEPNGPDGPEPRSAPVGVIRRSKVGLARDYKPILHIL